MAMNGSCETRERGADERAAASGGGAPERSAWLRAGRAQGLRPDDTPPRGITRSVIRDGSGGEASFKNLQMNHTSCGTSNFSRWGGSIRKNIIGHRMRRQRTWHGTGRATVRGTWHRNGRRMPVRGEQSFTRSLVRNAGRAFALLDQPAREHGASVLLDPLVEQSANLLAEIGGMAKTREFVALERIARRREKKLPRRLRVGTGHVGLLKMNACTVTKQ